MIELLRRTSPYLLATVLACGTFLGSLAAQFMFQLDPCPLCIGQRMLYMAAALLLLAGFLLTDIRPLLKVLGILLGLGAAAVALYQGYIATPEQLGQCGAPGRFESTLWWLAENVSYPLFAPEASCADAAEHTFMAMPMPFWSLVSGFALVVLLVVSLMRGDQRAS